MANIETNFAGLKLRSPIIVSSAGITETVDRMVLAQRYGAGAVVMKSLFEEEISRTSPTPRFMIIRHDTRNPTPTLNTGKTFTLFSYEQASEWGPERYAEEVSEAKRRLRIKIIPSINCITDEGWVRYARMMEEAGADAVELNTSCPHGSITFRGGEVENMIGSIVEKVRDSVRIPIIAKISPMLTSPVNLVKKLEEIGVDGVTIFNRMTGIDVDIDEERPVMHGSYAGHGGPWSILYPLRWISETYPQVKVHIAGSGGVTCAEDVVKYILFGATAVQTCTAVILNGYAIIEEFNRGLKEWMNRKGYRTLDEFRGKACKRILSTHEIDRRQIRVAKIDPTPTSPCKVDCPASVPIQAFVRLIAEEKLEDAWRMIKLADPFQSILSKICPHPCETACTRGVFDEPIAIRDLKRSVLNWGREKGLTTKAPEGLGSKGKSVAVIGAGPAGLTVANDLAKIGYDVTVYERHGYAGGMLREVIPEFRLSPEVFKEDIDNMRKLGVKFLLNTNVTDAESLLDEDYDAVFLGIGAHKGRALGVPGEDLEGVFEAIDFLRDIRLGKRVEIGKRVAVIGGGNSAVDAARTSVRLGAREVFILYRRTRDEMPATRQECNIAEAEGVKIMYLVVPVRILSRNGRVSGLECLNLYLSCEQDDSGRRAPKEVEGTNFMLNVDTVICALGQAVDSAPKGVSLTRRGTIRVDEETLMANPRGIFAGGDAVEPLTVVDAVASGRRAAIAIDRFLRGEKGPAIADEEKRMANRRLVFRGGETPAPTTVVGTVAGGILIEEGDLTLRPEPPKVAVSKHVVMSRYRDAEAGSRPKMHMIPLDEGTSTFKNVELGISVEEAVREAKRCFACGCGVGCEICKRGCIYSGIAWVEGTDKVAVSEKCAGCGLCSQLCPNDAISMVLGVPYKEAGPRASE